MSAQISQDSNALSDAILPDGGFRKQAALRALAAAISATRRYLAKPFISSVDDFVAKAEIAEKWVHAASYLGGVGECLSRANVLALCGAGSRKILTLIHHRS